MKRTVLATAAAAALMAGGAWAQGAGSVGAFESHGDVGTVLHPGAAEYDRQSRSYTISGSGENMWATADGFHFVWKKASGDVSLTADIAFPDKGGNAHKKAVLLIRQSLDADSAYADAALHGVGLTSLQSRETKGAATHEVQANATAPRRLRLVKRGDYFFLFVGGDGQDLQFSGSSMRVPIVGSFYVGLAVCAHDKDVVEKAVFTNVELAPVPAARTNQLKLYSTLETITVASTDRRVTYVAPERLESPTWSSDGKTLVFKASGRLMRVPETGGKPEPAEAAEGVAPERTVEAQLPSDEFNNINPHVSPNGRQVVFLSYPKTLKGDPKDTEVMLRMMNVATKNVTVLAKLVGGKGTIEAPSWSPDSRRLAFVSYHLVK